MGWFEEQVKKRKELDEQTFENSFKALAGLDNKDPKNVSEIEKRENYAIKQILSYFHQSMVDIPKDITTFNDKLNYALKQYNLEYHKVELNDKYEPEEKAPLLIFTIINNMPVVLFPLKKHKGYYYKNYETGKKVVFEASFIHRLELEAYSFYRPLPTNKRATVKEYIKYISKSVRPIDVILLLLFSALASAVGLLVPYLTKELTGGVVQSKEMNQFIIISIYVVAAATALLLVNAIKGFVNSRIAIKIEKSVSGATMMRVLTLPASFFKKYNTGELAARFSSVTSLANIIISSVFMTLVTVIMSFAYLFQLIGFAPQLILPVILILLASSSFTVATSFIQKKYTTKNLQLNSKEAGVTYEMINGIQKIRLSGSEKRVFSKWANAYSQTAKVRYNPPLALKLAPAISMLITLVGNVVLYYVAAFNNIDVGSYMAFTTSYGVLSGAFISLTQDVSIFFTIQPLFDMARPILETEPESNQGKITLKGIKGDIVMKDISFKYEDNGPLILNKLSLNIKEGEYLAIVGQTGCGKSTLVRLLLGFEEPLEGDITVDGINIKDIDLTSLRRSIGTVMQNGTLFHADIFSNIIISSPGLKEEDAWAAAEIANIADDIREMPMGMKTVISEGQGGISGGQKQRIMIARAIVHKPKILIFDEATSALDNKTQKSISESINRLNCTRIVIAHRLSTIKNADRIIMLEQGQIIEEGSYQQLIDKKGRFAELVDRQRLDNNK